MSTAILPSLAGLGIDVTRSPIWDTVVQQSLSGKETRYARQSYPRWKWELAYNVLRSTASYTELQQLAGFFNLRQGQYDTFLYRDVDDNTVTGQEIIIADGVKTTFQLIRTFGGFIEPVLAPKIVSAVYLNGALLMSGYAVGNWGSTTPGQITFTSAPASGTVITADFSYYWPVRMAADSISFSMFLSGYYKAKKFSFISVKN